MSYSGNQYLPEEQILLNELFNQEGILLVAAAGNAHGTELNYPASYDSVISVASVDKLKNIAFNSPRNKKVDIAAPGKNRKGQIRVSLDFSRSLNIQLLHLS